MAENIKLVTQLSHAVTAVLKLASMAYGWMIGRSALHKYLSSVRFYHYCTGAIWQFLK